MLRCSGLWQHSGAMTTGAGVHQTKAVPGPLPSLWIQAAERPIATVRRAAVQLLRLPADVSPKLASRSASSHASDA